MNTLIVVLLVFAVLAILIGVVFWTVPIARWYVAAFLARYDFIFTNVPESYFKVVVRFGAHRKTLLSKQGYKIDENGDIVPLELGETPETSLPGGLRLIGWPFIDRIYTREMKFLKSLPSGDIKIYEVEKVDKFYAKVDYPYALPFMKCEDINNLPLVGHATLLAHVVNPVKSLFATANFYDTMIGLILPSVRECLKGFGFDKLKEKDDLDELTWAKLEESNPEEPEGVIGKLFEKYGLKIVALRIVNVDPQDEELRKIGLTRYRAEREADAAGAIARKEAKLTGGTLTLMVDEQITAMEKYHELTKDDRNQIRAQCLNMLLRERAGKVGGLKDVRIANADGTPFARGSISEIVGGIVAAVAASASAKDNSGGKSPSDSSGKGGKKQKPEDMDDDEAVDNAFDDEDE